jgi:glyoxylase-like metal-dependent hydrolase (beta-lactamase superfamily II)
MIGETVFTGDSIFNPDVGSARCDFPGGDSRALWHSMQKLLSLPLYYRLYTGHDYPAKNADGAETRDTVPFTTVQDQREQNRHVREGTDQEEFVQWRSERDRSLGEPKLLHPSLQVNIRGGKLPKNTHTGRVYFKLPVDVPSELQ